MQKVFRKTFRTRQYKLPRLARLYCALSLSTWHGNVIIHIVLTTAHGVSTEEVVPVETGGGERIVIVLSERRVHVNTYSQVC